MKKAYLYIALTTIFFSSMEVALKIFSPGFQPLQMNFLRFLIGSLLLLPIALRSLRRRRVRLGAGDMGFFALTGLIGVVLSMTFYQLAIGRAEASVVAILFSCNPVFVVPFAYFLLGEKIRRATVASVLLSITGVLFIMNPLHINAGISGILLTLLAAALFALYGVVGKMRSASYGGLTLTALSFAAGSVEMLLLIGLTHLAPVETLLRGAGLGAFAAVPVFRGITWGSLPGLAYIGFGVTGLGYAFYFLSMEQASAGVVSTAFFIKPALAPLLALVILGETVTVNMAVGILLVLVGSLVNFRRAKDVPPLAPPETAEEDE